MSQKKCTCQITSQVALPVHLCSSGEDLQPFSRAPHLVFNYGHCITEHTPPLIKFLQVPSYSPG